MLRNLVLTVLVVLLVVGGAYAAYQYVKETPPNWLIKLVTKSEPPPPLPTGERAPLIAPEGFIATIYARDLPGARVMLRDPKGALLVSSTKEGKVLAVLQDLDQNGESDGVRTVLEGLRQPHGLAFHCPDTGNASADQDACVLYVAETDALKTYLYDADTMSATYLKTVTAFPSGRGHFTRTLWPHPDGKRLLISVGSSCNVCNEEHQYRATILSLDLATEKTTVLATGLRNSVFMATDPVYGEVWATDNGRDLIGDDIPPDEVNIIREGGDYGWPICYGKNVHDTDFDTKQYVRDPCADKIPSHIDLQAHSAALGLAFIPEEGWPDGYGNDLLIAFHGSWNRSTPTGYKVVRIDLADSATRESKGIHDFLTGFMPEGATDTDDAIGRPVGLLAEPGGTLYVSDDRAGAIYRVVRASIE